jgi:hypothetical protein
MGQGIGGRRGKILGLIALHADHTTAFEASLIERGLRWRDVGTERLDWADLDAVVEWLPYDAPLPRAINGKEWFWYHPIADLIAGAVDRLGLISAVVSRRDRIKKTEIPNPIPRPWDKEKRIKKIGSTPMPLRALRDRLGW